MSRQLFTVQKGFRMTKEADPSKSLDFLFGTGLPGGDAGEQDAAAIGSMYFRDDGSQFQKIAATNAQSDWQLNSAVVPITPMFRKDLVIRAITADTLSAGTRNLVTSPFSDDQAPTMTQSDFNPGDGILQYPNGQLYIVSYGGVDEIVLTLAAQQPQDNEGFVALNNLLNAPGGKENGAVFFMEGNSPMGSLIKLSDVNWNMADGISLNGLTPSVGAVTGSDTVQGALEKVIGTSASLSGVVQGSGDLGNFTGEIIPNAQNIKQALQALETFIETGDQLAQNAVTATVSLFALKTYASEVGSGVAVKIKGRIRDVATGAIKAFEMLITHDGSGVADAVNTDDTVYAELKMGSNFNSSIYSLLVGTGTAQQMYIQFESTEASGVDIRATFEVVKY